MKNSKFSQIFLAGLVIASLGLSCKKDYNPEFQLSRQFKPGDISVTQGETQVTLSWAASLFTTGKNVTYTVEVAKDGTFQGAIDYTAQVDTAQIIITDADLEVRQPYYARVKANALDGTAESGWVVNTSTFMITGEQIFLPIRDAELKDTSVVLRWRTTPNLTKITVTPNGGTAFDVPLSAGDVTAELKKINGLTPSTLYSAEVFKGTVSKGIISFTTKELNVITITLNPGDNLVNAVNTAVNGDVIGLMPGTYDCVDGTGTFTNLVVSQKTIGIQSVSGNPTDTKVNFKEITLKGTGAGIKLKGIDFDGAASRAAGADPLYFLNLTGLAADADNATFTSIKVENSYVHNMGNCLLRGNRGSSNGHKIDTVSFKNCKVYDNLVLNAYTFFTMDKLEFKVLSLTNSTFYGFGRALISYSTNITFPVDPSVLIDHCTINNFGRDVRTNFFIDANANAGKITLTNNIIGNTPMPGQTVGTALVRNSNAIGLLSNSNYFKLSDGAGTDLAWPGTVTQSSNTTIDPGWTSATTDFTLAPGSPLRTASSTGGAIGDPRWAF